MFWDRVWLIFWWGLSAEVAIFFLVITALILTLIGTMLASMVNR